MHDELKALEQNNTWVLVPRTPNMNVIGCKWIYKIKLKYDGSVEHYKARLVAQGYSQISEIDFDETFTPVIKPTVVGVVLSITFINKWIIRQLDVKNAFLHGNLKETVYIE